MINLTQSITSSHPLLLNNKEVDLIDAIIKGISIGNIKIGKKISLKLVLALRVIRNEYPPPLNIYPYCICILLGG